MIKEQLLDGMCDQTLLNHLSALVHEDRQHTARLLRAIEAIDRRQLWARLGHPSMFDFLVQRFHLSESTAGKRIGAARVARSFPVIFEMVACGELHLSGIHRLKAHLTPENHEHVLARAKHMTIRQVEQLLAALAPKADTPSSLRALPQRESARQIPSSDKASAASSVQATGLAQKAMPPTASPAPPCRAPEPAPLSPGRFQLRVTLDQAARDQLAQLQDLLAHQIPNGDPAVIVARALEALLHEVKKQKIGLSDKPRAVDRKPLRRGTDERGSRTIPARLRREIWTRDAGRCTFVGADGHRCGETRRLEFAHAHPWAKGGEHSAENLALRYRAHNAYEAIRDYGAHFIREKRSKRAALRVQALRVREPIASYLLKATNNTPTGTRHTVPTPPSRLGRKLVAPIRETWRALAHSLG